MKKENTLIAPLPSSLFTLPSLVFTADRVPYLYMRAGPVSRQKKPVCQSEFMLALPVRESLKCAIKATTMQGRRAG